MPSFNKLFYVTLTGERKLNGLQVYINKNVVEEAGISPDAIIEIKAEPGKIIIEEVKRA